MIFRRCWKVIRLAQKDVSNIRNFSSAPPSPLEGIRVLDMTRLVKHFGRYEVWLVLSLVKIDEAFVTGFWLALTAQ